MKNKPLFIVLISMLLSFPLLADRGTIETRIKESYLEYRKAYSEFSDEERYSFIRTTYLHLKSAGCRISSEGSRKGIQDRMWEALGELNLNEPEIERIILDVIHFRPRLCRSHEMENIRKTLLEGTECTEEDDDVVEPTCRCSIM